MNFEFTDQQNEIRKGVPSIASIVGTEYWLERDREGDFPGEFYRAVADAGWRGIATPEACGGAEFRIMGVVIFLQTIAEPGGAVAACSSSRMNKFGLRPVVVFGIEEQKQRTFPLLSKGKK